MAAKKKIINIKVYFDGDQDAKRSICRGDCTENKRHESER